LLRIIGDEGAHHEPRCRPRLVRPPRRRTTIALKTPSRHSVWRRFAFPWRTGT
jgi:hypothetical protein